MAEALEIAGLGVTVVEGILSLCKSIYKIAGNVKANKEHCQQIAQRVRIVEEQVLAIVQREPSQISAVVYTALQDLRITLESAKALMMKFNKAKNVKRILKASSHKDDFFKVDKKLNDNLQMLSSALQVEHGDVLQKVYETVREKKEPLVRPTILPPPTNNTLLVPMSGPTPPTPVSYIPYMHPMMGTGSVTYMPLYGSSISFCSTTTVSKSAMMSRADIAAMMAPKPAANMIPSMPFPAQNTSFVGGYVVNNSFFS